MVTETSLQAYIKIKDSLGPKQAEMLAKYEKWYPMSFSNLDMKKLLGWPISSITARRCELVERGLLVKTGRKRNTDTGMLNEMWRAKR
jgi:hypothetical protein